MAPSRGSRTWARPGPSARTRCGRRSGTRRSRRCPPPRSTTRSSPSGGDGRPGAGALRELHRGRGHGDPRHACVRRRRARPGRRVRPAHQPLPDRQGGASSRGDRGGALPPTGKRAVRPLHPREPAAGRGAGRRQHRRGGSNRGRVRPALGGSRHRVGGGALRRRCAATGRGGRDRQHHPLRLGRAPGDTAPPARVPGEPRWSSPSSARTTRGPWWRLSRSSRAGTST